MTSRAFCSRASGRSRPIYLTRKISTSSSLRNFGLCWRVVRKNWRTRNAAITRGARPGTADRVVRRRGLHLAKADLQNQLIASACNIKKWSRKLLGTPFWGSKRRSRAERFFSPDRFGRLFDEQNDVLSPGVFCFFAVLCWF